MPPRIRMIRAADGELLDEKPVPSDLPKVPGKPSHHLIARASLPELFDMGDLDATDVLFEMAAGPTDAYTTPAYVAPTIASVAIVLDSDATNTPLTTANVGDTVRAHVAMTHAGYPEATLAYVWRRGGTPISGATGATYTVTEDDIGEAALSVAVTATNAAGSDNAVSAAVDVEVSEATLEDQVIAMLAALHADGVPATLHNVSDISTLWQDLARTIPVTAPGQPVAVMDDKISGDHPMLIENEAERALYQTDGVRHWLEFNGVNNAMQTAGTFDVVNEVTLGLSGRFLDNSGTSIRNLTHFGLSHSDSGSTNYVRLGAGTTNNPIRHEFTVRYGAGNVRNSEYVTIAALNDDYASIGWGEGNTLHVVCGTESSSNTTEPDTAPGGQQPLRLGNSSGRRIYGAVFAHDVLPPSDRALLKAFLEELYA